MYLDKNMAEEQNLQLAKCNLKFIEDLIEAIKLASITSMALSRGHTCGIQLSQASSIGTEFNMDLICKSIANDRLICKSHDPIYIDDSQSKLYAAILATSR